MGNASLGYTYDGSLLIGTTWTGPVAGSVSRTYDTDFPVATESVNGGNAVTFQYDPDSLLTGAGALALTRSPQHGLLTGTTPGEWNGGPGRFFGITVESSVDTPSWANSRSSDTALTTALIRVSTYL